MIRRGMTVLICLVLSSVIPPPGGADEASADDRVEVEVDGGPSEDGGAVRLESRVGAQRTDNEASFGPDELRLTNPPQARAWRLDAEGFTIEREEFYGPPLATASLGTGALTANLDGGGRLTGLNWPGPGHNDHVQYLNVTRGWPNHGAAENAGSFGGILGHGWIHPAFGWELLVQSWSSADTATLRTRLRNVELDLDVTITDVVHPTEDLLARNFSFSRPVDGFVHYANMNPTTSRAPRVPSVFDGLLDPVSDFATVYADGDDAMLHFRPYTIDPAAASRLLTSRPTPADAADAVGGSFGSGVYVAIAGQGASGQYQAGLDSTGLVRDEASGSPLLDPFHDALDGELSGSPAAFGRTAGALGDLQPDGDASYTVYVSAAEDPSVALGTIRRARRIGFASVREDSDESWRAWVSRARLPATSHERTREVSKRALMLIRTAQDRRTGAIVANTTAQTPYRQDWPRDGAFFNYALSLAGYDEMVTAHNDFYRRIHRPGGTWDSFYYADGAEGGAVFPYEIDTQGFAIWALWSPFQLGAADLDDLRRWYPAIEETADALLLCTDPTNGMQCYAPEDDAVVPSQGAQGAATTVLGLESAVAAAHALGHRPDGRWEQRAAELREAALREVCGEDGCEGGRGGLYLVWPSRILDPDSPELAGLLRAHLDGYAEKLRRWASYEQPEVDGFFQYPMEPLLALGPFWDAPDADEQLRAWLRWLTEDVAAPGVLHYGERIYREGERSYLHSVGFPHIWSGAEVYLAAAFVHGIDGCPPGATEVGEAPCRSTRGEEALAPSATLPATGGGRTGWIVAGLVALLAARGLRTGSRALGRGTPARVPGPA